MKALGAASLELFTLGGLTIRHGAEPVRLSTRKGDALLVYLCCERREHSREWLADLLWDNVPQARAMGNLRTALVDLNQHLGDHLIVTRQSLMIDPEREIWLDSQVLADAHAAHRSDKSTAALRRLQTAVDIYKGDFLAGFHIRDAERFEQWQVAEAERLRVMIVSALNQLAEAALETCEYADGITYAQRLLNIDPLRENAHRTLMRLFAASGQRTAALSQYEACARVLEAELGVEPDDETTHLHKQIQNEQVTVSVQQRTRHVRLPPPPTPFVERPLDLQRVIERLRQPGCRLLTIIGMGGTGKTRLAVRAAEELADDFRDGVQFVSLAAVQQGEMLAIEIANQSGLMIQGSDPHGELLAFLGKRELLLVLDNFEHLVEHAALISDILQHAPQVRILVTSRIWLRLQEEWTLTIGGMEVPTATAKNADQYGAVRLFTACAQRVQPRFALEGNLEAVIDICDAVEGLPLGIELSAAWLHIISVSEIVHMISPKFLSTTVRNVPERHRSVETLFEDSLRLLPPEVASKLMRLSVFQGMFDREAAAAVAGLSLSELAILLEHSLIYRSGDTHYGMQELLRQFAFERLHEAEAIRDAHLNYYVALTANPDSRIHGQQQTFWLDRFQQEHDNLRTAITWSLESRSAAALDAGLRLAASIWEFWLMRGHITEGRRWLGLLLDATKGTISKARGEATQGAGYLAWIQGEHDKAEALHKEGLAIREAIGDKAGMGGSLSNLGVIAWNRGDFAAARTYYERAYAARREANYKLGMASVLSNLSLLMQDQSIYDEAIGYAEEAWALFKEIQDLQGMVHVLYNLGSLTYERGDPERARELQLEALQYAEQLGDKRIIGALLQNLSHSLMTLGDTAQARAYLEQSLDLVTQAKDIQHIGLAQEAMARLALIEGRLDEAQTAIQTGIEALRQNQATPYLSQTLLTQGDILRAQGKRNDAEAAYREALTMLVKINRPQPIAEGLYCLGRLLSETGSAEAAVILISAADSIAERYRLRFPSQRDKIERTALSASLTEDVFSRAAAQGAAMTIEEIAAYLDNNGLD